MLAARLRLQLNSQLLGIASPLLSSRRLVMDAYKTFGGPGDRAKAAQKARHKVRVAGSAQPVHGSAHHLGVHAVPSQDKVAAKVREQQVKEATHGKRSRELPVPGNHEAAAHQQDELLQAGQPSRKVRRAGKFNHEDPPQQQQARHASTLPDRPQSGGAAAPHHAHGFPPPASAPHAAKVPKPINSTALQHQSETRFDSLPICPNTKKAMADVFGYEFCTKVQAQALPVCLSGKDVLAKAKTGTGKTLAFMIPALENLLRSPPRPGQVGVLVLSPTRELAMQIHAETEKLVRFQKMSIQVVIGGTNMNSESKRLQARAPDVLVATPGRCLDHLSNGSGMAYMMKDLRMLVLDEADNVLDMGFRPTIQKILGLLPNKDKRQTLLFSATFPKDVQELAKFAFRPDYQVVDTVGAETGTNVQVEQRSCVVPHKDVMVYLKRVLQKHMEEEEDFKIIVFFPTARMTQLYSETFQKMGIPALEMHSRKSQAVRTRMSEEFRAGSGVVMFSSDVSARGVDYPDVGLVVQVGLPSDKDQYVHRVGRTARAGKAGKSVLLLTDFEAPFLDKLRGLPVKTMSLLPDNIIAEDAPLLARALSKVSPDTKGKAYAAWLGFYKSAPTVSMAPTQLVQTANEFSKLIGCSEPPELEAKTVGKMGLKNVAGLRIQGRAGYTTGPATQGGGGRR